VIGLADEVTDAGDEDHDKGEDDEIQEDAAHDVGPVVGGEIGQLEGLCQAGEGTAHQVEGELDEEEGHAGQRADAGDAVDSEVVHEEATFLVEAGLGNL
jgi:hypothetical protein